MNLPMDDNLRGLLVELAERPERTVLGTRVRRFQDLLRPDVEVLRPTAGMGVVEAKLLEAHREELAWLLLQASRVRFGQLGLQQVVPRDERGNSSVVSLDLVQPQVAAITSSSFVGNASVGALQLLAGAMSAAASSSPTPAELAVASIRLDPRQTTRIWLGTYIGIDGNSARAIEIQLQSLGQCSKWHEGFAWANIAGECARLARFHEALEAARSSFISAPGFGLGAFHWFLAAVQCGDVRETCSAANAMSDAITEDSDEAHEYLRFLTESRRNGAWRPTSASTKARAVRNLPALAERFLETFQ